jgi:hypothetical protein
MLIFNMTTLPFLLMGQSDMVLHLIEGGCTQGEIWPIPAGRRKVKP